MDNHQISRDEIDEGVEISNKLLEVIVSVINEYEEINCRTVLTALAASVGVIIRDGVEEKENVPIEWFLKIISDFYYNRGKE